MADVHNKAVRSYNMSKIKGKNTKPEILIRKFLFSHGFRYRLHDPRLPGRPDIVLTKYRTVIFINGCFWHGHSDCRYYVIPKTNTEWWVNKINKNTFNDEKSIAKLHEGGWRVITVWECEIRTQELFSYRSEKLLQEIVDEV